MLKLLAPRAAARAASRCRRFEIGAVFISASRPRAKSSTSTLLRPVKKLVTLHCLNVASLNCSPRFS